MSERKFNREQDDTEPVKFKPLYLIIGICVFVILISACAIYFFLNREDKKEFNEPSPEVVVEPTKYVIPETACKLDVNVSQDLNSLYSSCEVDNVILNFIDINFIVDMQKENNNFHINGLYYDGLEVKNDSISNFTFNKISVALVDNNIALFVNDATSAKKSLLYIIKEGKIVYSMGSNNNTVFSLTNLIQYSTYSILDVDCKVNNPNDVVYQSGVIKYDGSSYSAVFEKNYLVSDVCKAE